jgi:type I restriction enzyme, S subunit
MELTATKYKQTEVGLIPEDWKVKSLGDVGEVKMCKRIFSYQTKDNGDIPFYKIGTFGKEPDAFISREIYNEFRKKYSFPSVGSVLISASGTIGRLVVFDGTDAYFQDSNIIWIENNNQVISNEYLKHSFPNVRFQTEGGTIKRLYNNILKSGLFPCPPNEDEQKAIAQVLSDTDSLIQALEKKIAKKKDIKKGVMQKLLTPKKDWAIKTLGEVFIISAASSKKTFFKDGGKYIVMDMGSVSAEGKILNYKRAICNFDILRKGDLVMPKDDIGGGNIIGKVGYIDNDDSYVLSDHVYKLSLSCNTVNPLFMAYVINGYRVNSSLRSKATGSAQLGLGRSQVLNQEISYPKKEEQNQIAQTLFDMDEEIENLKQKLSKYQLAKQGMMQQLLTGKIRLV